MCYAEFASTVPVAGSAYTFSYATLGELVAWIIGWDLVLELALGASVVAKGWSLYLGNLFTQFGGSLETTISLGPLNFDWGAVIIVAVITWVLVLGTKLSARANMVITGIKVAVVLLVIIVGFFYFNASNLSPFIPPSEPAPTGSKSGLEQPLLQLIIGGAPSTFGGSGCCPRPRWCSSRSSGSTWSPPRPRRPGTRGATCRAGSSARWRSSPCCTCWSPSC